MQYGKKNIDCSIYLWLVEKKKFILYVSTAIFLQQFPVWLIAFSPVEKKSRNFPTTFSVPCLAESRDENHSQYIPIHGIGAKSRVQHNPYIELRINL